jgi:hypothetical protein
MSGWTGPAAWGYQVHALQLETDLADGVAPADSDQAARDGRGLTYPHPVPPGFGEAVTVAPGVLWMRLSMPIALNHINVYAVEDGDGWVLVDTGLSRLGLTPAEAVSGLLDGLAIDTLHSHLACAEDGPRAMNERQRAVFAGVAARVSCSSR